jgi:hypothetical protein
MNFGGYGSICKRDKHRPGSALLYENSAAENVIENFADLGNRFAPSPPTRSLAYRYDNINADTPNSYPEFTSPCRGQYFPRYTKGQVKSGAPQGATSQKAPTVRQMLQSSGTGGSAGGGCSGAACSLPGTKLDPILDPRFNLREAAKQLILLEDHLFHSERRCDDCINKHRLTLEAFLEEAVTLDKTGEYNDTIVDTLDKFRTIMHDWVERVRRRPDANVSAVYLETAQRLRDLRKPLCMRFCDFC